MKKSPRLSWKLAAAGLVFLGGCSAAGPYVYREAEFNRAAPAFGQSPKDRGEVTICYSSQGAQPPDILALAEAACVKFGKTAVFASQDWRTCPLVTPVAANFRCVGR